MEILAAGLSTALNIFYVVLGLGFVIFFHELGHFAVAKWCDVHVERFSLGFGPVLWRFKPGETEYALSAIPFGGYVKMLGQDDLDPSQLSSDDIARDPRSYSAKSVPQRMAIISAGVAMNVLTGMAFFAVAFGLGVEQIPSVVGSLQPGYPAWVAGLERGDRIDWIDGRRIDSFGDIMRGVALSKGAVHIVGVHFDGESFDVTVTPDETGPRRIIGAGPSEGLTLWDVPGESIPPVSPGTPAAAATPPFEPGDVIRRVDDTPVSTFKDLEDYLAAHRDQPVEFFVRRQGRAADDLVGISVSPQPFRTPGLWTDIGRITAVRQGSPAERSGLQVGDKIAKINDQDVGTTINPLKLPDVFGSLHGQDVAVTVTRKVEGSGHQEVTVHLVPNDEPGWIERPVGPGVPLSVPSVGIAFHMIPTVLKVEPDGPADRAGIRVNERIKSMELAAPADGPSDLYQEKVLQIDFGGENENWAYAFWMMQQLPTRQVSLIVSDELGQVQRRVALVPRPADDWFVPSVRGLRLQPVTVTRRADGILQAVRMGFAHTHNSMMDIYLTLRNLIARRLSFKNLYGPVGIAKVAYDVVQQGLSELLLFLGFLSVNLAVLNFLPIPVLDGGHMVFLAWEAVIRRRPSERVVVTATYIGMAFVLGLIVLVVYLDIHRLATN